MNVEVISRPLTAVHGEPHRLTTKIVTYGDPEPHPLLRDENELAVRRQKGRGERQLSPVSAENRRPSDGGDGTTA